MIGFEKLEYALPNTSKHISQLAEEVNLAADILKEMKKGGLAYIPISNQKIDTLIQQAINKINILKLDEMLAGVIYAQSVPVKIDLFKNIPSTTISGQACSIFHTALELASFWLETTKDKKILIIGADKVVSTNERLFFNSAMGDVAIVGLLSKKNIIHQILSINVDSYLFADNGELSSKEQIQRFRENNPLLIRKNIKFNLQKLNLKLKDIQYIFPHTPYLKIWDLMAEVLKYPRQQIITNYINQTGHLNSNDSFLHYLRAIEDGILKKGEIVLLINPGFGGTRGSTIIKYLGNDN